MTDEKFTFIEDLREKKKTATGAHHKRTHCGKGGAVRFPSDYKTAKELRAMNGEVKEYRLNDPVRWGEFKKWPDDIKVLYIKSLRKAYNVSDTKIAEMMGVSSITILNAMKRLGISAGHRSGRTKWDEDGWYAWVNGVPVKAEDEAFEVAQEIVEAAEAALESEKCDEEVLERAEKCDTREDDVAANHVFHFNAVDDAVVRVRRAVRPSIPGWGQMELEGTVEECAATLQMLLADSRVKLSVSWTVVE